MPGAGARSRSPAAAFRRHAEDVAASSPLQHRLALALAGSDAAMEAVAALPARRRRPELVLAALHDLTLAGRAPTVAPAQTRSDGTGDPEAVVAAALDVLTRRTAAVADVVARRRVQTLATTGVAVLRPAVAEAARRAGAGAVGLVDVGGPAGTNPLLDLLGTRYDDGPVLGDPTSPVQLAATVVGPGRVPTTPLPQVLARVRLDRDPLDLTDPGDARWLRACLLPDRAGPDRAGPAAELGAALALAATTPVELLRGDPVDGLPDAVGRVPAGALPVVMTTWALSALSPARRRAFVDRLQQVAADRPLAWVSVEGVGVAPGVPTLGDRPASGHSIAAVALPGAEGLRIEVVGRCWSRGRLLSWLAG